MTARSARGKLWTKDYSLDAIVNFLVYFSHYLTIVTIALYVMDRFGASAMEAGLAYGVYIIGGLVARLFTGSFIDRIGRKRTLSIGLVSFLAATLCYFAADSFPALLVVRFFHGAGWGMAATATGIIVAYLIPRERVGEGTGYYALSVTLASAVGPLLGMIVIVQNGFAGILVCATLLAVAALAAACFLKVPEPDRAARAASRPRNQYRANDETAASHDRRCRIVEPSALPISIVSFFAGVGIASVFSFLTAYVQSIDQVAAGELFFLVYAVAMVVTRPFTGRLFDRKGENAVMYPALALFVAGLIVLGCAPDGTVLLLAGAILGVGYGSFVSSAQALAVKKAPVGRIGLATSTFFALLDFGSGIAPSLLGMVVPFAGYRGLYALAASVVLLCVPLYAVLHRERPHARALVGNPKR